MMTNVLIQLVKALLVLAAIDVALLGFAAMRRCVDAKMSGIPQPKGFLRPVIDFVKALYKENLVPEHVDRTLYTIAPAIALVPAVLAIAVLPFGTPVAAEGRTIELQLASLDTGVLFVLATGLLAMTGIVYGSFAANNKFAMLGGLRATAQILALWTVYAFAIIGVVMLAGSLRLESIVAAQAATWAAIIPKWNVFLQPLGFLLFAVSMFAVASWRPFDTARSGDELVTGYATEHDGVKLALFTCAESVLLLTQALLLVLLFFGGWHLPGLELIPWPESLIGGLLAGIVQVTVLALKTTAVVFFFQWVRWSLPRFRHDQMLRLGWKWLVPLVLLNLVATGAVLSLVTKLS